MQFLSGLRSSSSFGPLSKSIGGLTVKVTQAALAFVTILVLTNVFGIEIFGSYAYGVATATLLAVFAQFGFHVYCVYGINRALDEGRPHDVSTLIVVSLVATAGFSVLAGGGLCLVALALPDWQMSGPLKVAAALVGPIALVQVLAGTLQAFNRVVLGLSLDAIGRPTLFLGSVLVALALGWHPTDLGFAGLLWLYIGTQIALIVFALGVIYRLHQKAVGAFRPALAGAFRTHMRASLPFVTADAMIELYMHAGLIATGIWLTPSDVALFRVVTQISLLIAFALQALQAALLPPIARASGHPERKAELQGQITLATRVMLAIQSPLMLTIFLAPGFLLSWFGEEFPAAATILVILAAGQTVNLVCGANGAILNMNGFAGVTARWSIVAVAAVWLLILVLVPNWGLLGAALAVAMSRLLWNAALVVEAARRTGLHSTAFGRLSWLAKPSG